MSSGAVDATERILRWTHVDRCPACRSSARISRGAIAEKCYKFGNTVVDVPFGAVHLLECTNCRLIYKSVIPDRESMVEILSSEAGAVWAKPYRYGIETRTIRSLLGNRAFDLLDIGPGNGHLLAALDCLPGRRAALDVKLAPSVAGKLRGEFIEGLIENDSLPWCREPYDVVTLFDVLEHLYDAAQAFCNLRELVKPNGLVLIETGNSRSAYPTRYGIGNWWYVNLLEHHIFWRKETLIRLGSQFGFLPMTFASKRHKGSARYGTPAFMRGLAKIALYRISSKTYFKIAKLARGHHLQPMSPIAKDHLFVVFRKVK